MFTGIVERSVRVASVSDGTGFRRLNLAVDWPDVKLGESVAVNGVCLTVAEVPEAGLLAFDVVPETLTKTNLGLVGPGDLAHVERSVRVGGRIDGHFVQGHVDGRALLLEHVTTTDGEWRMRVEAPEDLARYIVPKGSACLDGVSLTVASVNGNVFEVALIPTTLRITTFQRRERGWPLNFEADVVTKTIVSWLERRADCGDTDAPATTRSGTGVASPGPRANIREQLAANVAAMAAAGASGSGAQDDDDEEQNGR
jgi:riboflavin synthase